MNKVRPHRAIVLESSKRNSILNMGAEESTMYPAQERTAAPVRTNGPTQTAATGTKRTRGPAKIQQPLVPQAVLLVGYTPEGAPILMSNPSQNTVATLTSTQSQRMMTTQPPIYETQSPVASALFSTPDAAASVPMAADTNQNYIQTLLQDQTPVMAVPKTILGPDGNAYTVLVRPTSSAGTSCPFPFYSPIFYFFYLPCPLSPELSINQAGTITF